jgi:hypothetical protein
MRSGRIGIQLAKKGKPGLILCDVVRPELDRLPGRFVTNNSPTRPHSKPAGTFVPFTMIPASNIDKQMQTIILAGDLKITRGSAPNEPNSTCPEITNCMSTGEKFSICDLSTAPQRSSAVYAEPFAASTSLQEKDLLTPYDLDRALAEAAQEMKFDWPEFLPIERIKAGMVEIAFGLLLFAALVAFCRLN